MSEWRTVKLGAVCDITSSKRIYASDYQKEGIPFYRGKEIIEKYNGALNVSTEIYITREKYEQIASKYSIPEAGDMLLTSVGTLGIPYVVKPHDIFYFKDGNLTWFKDFEDLDSLFLYYWILSPDGKAQLKRCTIGSSQSAFTIVLLKQIELSIPSVETQRRIAAILSAYDDLIENNTRRIKLLEQAAHDLYREWFVEFRFPGHESVPLVDSGTEYGMIPQEWKVRTIADSFDIMGGGTPSTKNPEYWGNGDIVWFSPSDLTASNSMFIFDSSKHITTLGLQKSSAKMFPAYSVMMTSRATLGVTAINTVPACTNQGFITCIPNELVSAYQIYFWIAENLEKIISVASGATFKEINKTTFRQFPFLIADKSIAERFNKIVEPIGNQIENLLHRNNALREARDLLLPRLVSGQVDVSEIELKVTE